MVRTITRHVPDAVPKKEEENEEEDEEEEEEDEEGGESDDSSENCWRCRDDMCFKHAIKGLGLNMHALGGGAYAVGFPQSDDEEAPPAVPSGELEFNDEGPPQDVPVRQNAKEEFVLEKFLVHNNNIYPPTRVKQDENGKFRVYCYPGFVADKIREWTNEYENSKK